MIDPSFWIGVAVVATFSSALALSIFILQLIRPPSLPGNDTISRYERAIETILAELPERVYPFRDAGECFRAYRNGNENAARIMDLAEIRIREGKD